MKSLIIEFKIFSLFIFFLFSIPLLWTIRHCYIVLNILFMNFVWHNRKIIYDRHMKAKTWAFKWQFSFLRSMPTLSGNYNLSSKLNCSQVVGCSESRTRRDCSYVDGQNITEEAAYSAYDVIRDFLIEGGGKLMIFF